MISETLSLVGISNNLEAMELNNYFFNFSNNAFINIASNGISLNQWQFKERVEINGVFNSNVEER